MTTKPLGIPRADPTASVSPAEHLALEAERLAHDVAALLARVDATPSLRAGPERQVLAGVLAELRRVAQVPR